MTDFKYITEDTDLSKCKIHYMDWDVNIYGKNYTVCRIEGYYHGEGGKYGLNDYYCFPSDEKPSYENLVCWWCDSAVRWGIRAEENIRIRSKWGETEADNANCVVVTRNDKDFYTFGCSDLSYGIAKAQAFIIEVQEGPVDVNKRGFDEELVGRKIWYYGMPAIIEQYIWGQHCICIVADNEEHKFNFPDHMKDEDGYWEEYVDGMKVDCTSSRIEWFPDYRKV